jgi:nucleoside-diphosphate-sugar epimerase
MVLKVRPKEGVVMTEINTTPTIQTAFVTGATGLLGNNLVRLLLSRGVGVKALARSREKAERQFAGLPVEIVTGDLSDVARFAARLKGVDVVFHTAAYFRDSFNPRSSGQVILDFINRKLPGVPPATFSLVDARDVAEALRLAALKGRSGERYLAAGRHTPMSDLFHQLERITGVPAPRMKVPTAMMFALAAFQELWARLTGKRFRSVEETLGDAICWYRENGWLSKDAERQGQPSKRGQHAQAQQR